jgi:hypothetical protein
MAFGIYTAGWLREDPQIRYKTIPKSVHYSEFRLVGINR